MHGKMAVRCMFYVLDLALQSTVSPAGEEVQRDAWITLIDAGWDPDAAAGGRKRSSIKCEAMGLDWEDG